MKNGEYIDKHLNGCIKSQTTYKNGEIDGIYRIWYNNGILAFSMEMKDGKRHGDYYHYHADGTLKYHSKYKDDIELKGTYELCSI
jgi:antitoxin component YwqK of YwqJK toxin-antitoxin module